MCNNLRGRFSISGIRQCECLHFTVAFIHAEAFYPHTDVSLGMVVAKAWSHCYFHPYALEVSAFHPVYSYQHRGTRIY